MLNAKVRLRHNVEYTLRDKDGNIKPLFRPNRLFSFLMKMGIVSPKFPKIPFFLGSWQQSLNISNLITNAGMAAVANLIIGTGNAFDYIAIGTGTTGAAAGDTALESEIASGGGERAQDASPTRETTDVTNDTAVLNYTFTFTDSFAVTEAGLLNAASDGDLLARQVFSAINAASGDTLAITWKIDVD